MNRRDCIKTGVALLTSVAGLSMIACSKKTIIQWAQTVTLFLGQTLPYFKDLLPGSVDVLMKAILVAKDLQAALAAGSESAIEFLNQLLAPNGLFQKLLDDVGLIPDPEKRKIVSGILAIAGVALTIISTALSQGAGTAPPKVVAAVRSRNVSGAATIESVAQSDVLTNVLKSLKK